MGDYPAGPARGAPTFQPVLQLQHGVSGVRPQACQRTYLDSSHVEGRVVVSPPPWS
jgi:hypothetical protein